MTNIKHNLPSDLIKTITFHKLFGHSLPSNRHLEHCLYRNRMINSWTGAIGPSTLFLIDVLPQPVLVCGTVCRSSYTNPTLFSPDVKLWGSRFCFGDSGTLWLKSLKALYTNRFTYLLIAVYFFVVHLLFNSVLYYLNVKWCIDGNWRDVTAQW